MLKKNERFLVASQDNIISLRRLRSNGKLFDNFICERILSDKFGLISSIQIPIIDQDLVVVGGCDGFIRLYDVSQNLLIAEIQGSRNAINVVVIQERFRNGEHNFVVISDSLDDKCVRFVIYAKKNDGKKEHFVLTGKNEEFGVFGSNCRAKMQLFGSSQPTILLVDEKKQEMGIMDVCFK